MKQLKGRDTALILVDRVRQVTDDEQWDFRTGIGCVDQIFK